MIALELITEEIPPLKHSDSGETALRWMEEFKVEHLPVLKGNNFVGLVSEENILDRNDIEQSLDKLFDHLPRPYVKQHVHIYEILAKISDEKITAVPVLDDHENYVGVIDIKRLMQHIADTGSMKEVGGIIVLEIAQHDYSLAHIAQIVESDNAKILSAYVSSLPSSTKLEVTLKINQTELGRIIRSLERYDYIVKASYQKNTYHEDLKNRYDELINYLNI
ncbi:CBS domain-containing protein [Lishizhenia tianjinensis]|uniref:CBS domain-containing protein n=1 Tax=Lishizhenia tianjinensis TaxID=477690 RepID=A0A1I6ZXZ3_9FLAO|nr:CBS domain-containing protein [Lishizhenia tianjinensis]SFT67542.1 CBS domain-containing protein [Lishizhenia tianjinensis]